MTVQAGSAHHIILHIGGERYRCRLVDSKSAYQERDVNAFAPKMASGDLGYSDMSIWNTIAQEDFGHGFGHREFNDPKGYHKSVGSVDTRHAGVAQLATKMVESDANLTAQVYQYLDYGGYVFAATGNGLKILDVTWKACTDEDVNAGEVVYALLNDGQYLYAGIETDSIARASSITADPNEDQTAFDTAFDTAGTAANFKFLAMGGGRLWAAIKDQNYIHYATASGATDWEGDSADTNRIVVGPGTGTCPITAMCWFNGFMYVAREDGLWAISTEDDIARQVLDWSDEKRSDNGAGMLVWNNKLVIPLGPRLFSFTGYTISEITPPIIGLQFPYTQYGNYAAMTTFGPYLYVAAQRGEATAVTYTETLRPSGAGSYNQLSPGTSSNYTLVDDTTPDYFTTYVYNATTSLYIDTYAFDNTSAASGKTIASVVVNALVYSNGNCNYYARTRVSGANYGHSTAYNPSSYQWHSLSWTWTTNPHTSAAWTSAEIDGAEFGLLAYPDYVGGQARCTQLWVEVNYTETVAPYDLLCFDGASWHNLGALDDGGKALYVSPASDKMWLCTYDSDAANYNTWYMQVQEDSFLPYDSYSTTGTHSLYTSRMDCGLKAVDKCWHQLRIHSENLTSARYITAYYCISGDTWVSLGNVTESPIQTIDLSDIVSKTIQFRFDFVTDTAAQSPVLEAWALEYLPRPDTIYGYNITLDVGDSVRHLDGQTEIDRGAHEIRRGLRSARNSTIPITMETPFGTSVNVIVTAYNILSTQVIEGKGLEVIANLNLVETD